MYKLLKEILKELKGIRKELHIIESNTESCNLTCKIYGSRISNENDIDIMANRLNFKLLDSIEP